MRYFVPLAASIALLLGLIEPLERQENTPNSIEIIGGRVRQSTNFYRDIAKISEESIVFNLDDLEGEEFPEAFRHLPTIQSGSERFSFARFAEEHRTPVPLCQLTEIEKEHVHADTKYLVQDMVIKAAHHNTVAVSRSLAQFMPIIHKIFQFEKQENEFLSDYYAYLTIDQRHIDVGESLRTAGWHIDGMHVRKKGERPERISRIYTLVISDTGSNITEYTEQGFVDLVAFDAERYNIFRAMDYLVDPQKVRAARSAVLYYMDAYTVHRSPVATTKVGKRTFLRVQLTPKKFDRLGNTISPYFGNLFSYHSKDFPVLEDPSYLLKK